MVAAVAASIVAMEIAATFVILTREFLSQAGGVPQIWRRTWVGWSVEHSGWDNRGVGR